MEAEQGAGDLEGVAFVAGGVDAEMVRAFSVGEDEVTAGFGWERQEGGLRGFHDR